MKHKGAGNMDTIGKRIQKYRKEKGLTQEELAGIMEVSPQAVSKWETDASCPDMGLVPKLCRTLGMTSDELICGHINEDPSSCRRAQY